MARANLITRLSLDTTRFRAGLAAASARVASFGGALKAIGGFAKTGFNAVLSGIKSIKSGLLAISAATAGFGFGLKKAFDLGGRLSDLSARSGESVKDLAIMEQAFKNAGIPAEELGITLDRLTRRTEIATQGNNSYAKALEAVGLDPLALLQMSKIDRLKAFGEALDRMGPATKRTLAAMDLLDTGGGRLNALFGGMAGNMQDAANQVGKQADILQRQADQFDRVADAFGLIKTKASGFFVGVADIFTPTMISVAERFENIDLASKGQAFGDAILDVLKNISALPDVLISGFLLASAELINALRLGMVQVASTLGAALQVALIESGKAMANNPVTKSLMNLAGVDISPLASADVDFKKLKDGIFKSVNFAMGGDKTDEALIDLRDEFKGNVGRLLRPDMARRMVTPIEAGLTDWAKEGFQESDPFARDQRIVPPTSPEAERARLMDKIFGKGEPADFSAGKDSAEKRKELLEELNRKFDELALNLKGNLGAMA